MNLLRLSIVVFVFVLMALIALPLLYTLSLASGWGFPFLSDDGAFRLVMTVPMLLPFVIMLFVFVMIVLAPDWADSEPTSPDGFEPTSSNRFDSTHTTPETADPLDVLQETYVNGEITHEEYEQRLQLLLDVDSIDELQERFEERSASERRESGHEQNSPDLK